MTDLFEWSQLTALGSIVLIDIVLSGDNAIVIGMAVAGLPAALRKRAIVIGILLATALRICFALVVVQLLQIVGLLLAGGLLLLWVCWRMWRDIRGADRKAREARIERAERRPPATTMRQALLIIVIADVTMSLDNVLAVGGAAKGNEALLVFGLALSIALMAFAANFIANLLQRRPWIAYLGLATILYVACDMIWRGSVEVMAAMETAALTGLTSLAA